MLRDVDDALIEQIARTHSRDAWESLPEHERICAMHEAAVWFATIAPLVTDMLAREIDKLVDLPLDQIPHTNPEGDAAYDVGVRRGLVAATNIAWGFGR